MRRKPSNLNVSESNDSKISGAVTAASLGDASVNQKLANLPTWGQIFESPGIIEPFSSCTLPGKKG